jgi:hypothetical protein
LFAPLRKESVNGCAFETVKERRRKTCCGGTRRRAGGGSIGGIAANLLAGRAIHAAGYVPVFCVLGFCHLTAFAVLVLTGRKGVSNA